MKTPRNLYCINFTRVKNNLNTYNATANLADLQTLKSLGFNCVRIAPFAANPANSHLGSFTFPQPTTTELANFSSFFTQAKTAGMKVKVCMFDHWGSFGRINDSKTWAAAMLGAADLSVLAAVELQNEIQFAKTTAYTGTFDAGWTGSTDNVNYGQAALGWAQAMIPYLKSLTPKPVTLSCTSYGNPPTPYGDLIAAVAGLTGNAVPDWWEWHCYSQVNDVSNHIRGAINVIPRTDELVIGEYNLHPQWVPAGTSDSQLQQLQLDYIQTVRYWCKHLNLVEPQMWEMYDNGDVTPLGLFKIDGTPKKALQSFLRYPPNLPYFVPYPGFNGKMRNTFTDSDGNTLPSKWYLYKGNNKAQPIVSNVVTQGHGSSAAIVLSGSAATDSSDNAPGVQVDLIERNAVTEGNTYTAEVWLKGSGDTGSAKGYPKIYITWWRSDGGYISTTNGPSVDLSSGDYSFYSFSGVAPALAASAKFLVAVGYNAGQVFVSDAKWTPPLGRLAKGIRGWYRNNTPANSGSSGTYSSTYRDSY